MSEDECAGLDFLLLTRVTPEPQDSNTGGLLPFTL